MKPVHILCDMSEDGLDEWLGRERLRAERWLQTIHALAALARAMGSDVDGIEVLVERLRECSTAEQAEFITYAGNILNLVGVAEPVAQEGLQEDSEQSGSPTPIPLSPELEPIRGLLEQNASDSVTDTSGADTSEPRLEGSWLRRVDCEQLDEISSIDQAMCHIKEATAELMEIAGIDQDYFSAELCYGMLQRLRDESITAFTITDEYLEGLIRMALEYQKSVPMSVQIINSVCFFAALKGVPTTAILPYRAITWDPSRRRGPSNENVTSSRYFVEKYVRSTKRDAAQRVAIQARQAEAQRIDNVFGGIATSERVAAEQPLAKLAAERLSKLFGFDDKMTQGFNELIGDVNAREVSEDCLAVVAHINEELTSLSGEKDILSEIGHDSPRGGLLFRGLIGRFVDDFGSVKLGQPRTLYELLKDSDATNQEASLVDLFLYLSELHALLSSKNSDA